MRLEFWKGLLSQAKTHTPRFANRSPSKDNWIDVGAGKSGISIAYVIRSTDTQVELYIDQGDREKNKQIFDTLYENRDKIERVFGKQLDWQRLDEKRASRVRYVIEDSGLSDQEKWLELQMKMINAMIQFEKAFRPFIETIS